MRSDWRIPKFAFALLTLYVGTFSYWWLSSPVSQFAAKDGRQYRVVEFQFNKVSFHTYFIWVPAFWYMEHVVGYHPAGFVASYDQSIQEYVK
jgi:hypothetical protein